MSCIFHSDECDKLFILCLIVLNTPKKPTGTHFSSTVDHGVSEMVKLDSPVPQSAFCLAHSPEFKPQDEQLNFFHPSQLIFIVPHWHKKQQQNHWADITRPSIAKYYSGIYILCIGLRMLYIACGHVEQACSLRCYNNYTVHRIHC